MGVWALAASNTFFWYELRDAMFETVVFSVHPRDLGVWLDHLSKKEERRSLNPRSGLDVDRRELRRLLDQPRRLADPDERHRPFLERMYEYHRHLMERHEKRQKLFQERRGTSREFEAFDESSDDPDDVNDILEEVGELKRVRKLRHLTIAGPLPESLHRYDIKKLRNRAPNLKSIGIQCQDAAWQWLFSETTPDSRVANGAWRQADFVKWMQKFPATTTIALEAMIWAKRRSIWNDSQRDRQSRVRIIRQGKKAAGNCTSGWEDADVVTEVVNTNAPAACWPRGTMWQQWWTGKGSRALF